MCVPVRREGERRLVYLRGGVVWYVLHLCSFPTVPCLLFCELAAFGVPSYPFRGRRARTSLTQVRGTGIKAVASRLQTPEDMVA